MKFFSNFLKGLFYLSFVILLIAFIGNIFGFKEAKIIANAGVFILIVSPLSIVLYIASIGLKNKDYKIFLYCIALIAVLVLNIILN